MLLADGKGTRETVVHCRCKSEADRERWVRAISEVIQQLDQARASPLDLSPSPRTNRNTSGQMQAPWPALLCAPAPPTNVELLETTQAHAHAEAPGSLYLAGVARSFLIKESQLGAEEKAREAHQPGAYGSDEQGQGRPSSGPSLHRDGADVAKQTADGAEREGGAQERNVCCQCGRLFNGGCDGATPRNAEAQVEALHAKVQELEHSHLRQSALLAKILEAPVLAGNSPWPRSSGELPHHGPARVERLSCSVGDRVGEKSDILARAGGAQSAAATCRQLAASRKATGFRGEGEQGVWLEESGLQAQGRGEDQEHLPSGAAEASRVSPAEAEVLRANGDKAAASASYQVFSGARTCLASASALNLWPSMRCAAAAVARP